MRSSTSFDALTIATATALLNFQYYVYRPAPLQSTLAWCSNFNLSEAAKRDLSYKRPNWGLQYSVTARAPKRNLLRIAPRKYGDILSNRISRAPATTRFCSECIVVDNGTPQSSRHCWAFTDVNKYLQYLHFGAVKLT